MDRNREGRRPSNMAASNGLLRRRQQRTARDSPEEDGQIEFQETARLRERGGGKRERDRELSSRNKRSRRGGGGDRLVQESNKEEGEETTEESTGYEDEYEIEDGGVSRLRPPPRALKQVSGFRVPADEMIGVSVPRKARSASVKRSHDSWVSGNGGFGSEDRRASTSPAASRSFEAASPSSSNVSVRRKTKPSGPKTRLPKVSKCSTSSVQEDIEIEIAEVLYGLKKQSHGSKKEEKAENDLQKLDSMDANDSKSSPNSNFAQKSILNQNNASASNSLLGLAWKKQIMDADSVVVQNGLIASAVTDEMEGDAKMEDSATKSGKTSFYTESSEVSHNMGASKLACGLESQEEAIKQQDSKPAIEESGVLTKEKSALPEEKSPVCNKVDVDFHDSVLEKSTSNVLKVESQREERLKIDLMAPPPMASSPEQDSFVDLSLDRKPAVQGVAMKMENVVKNEGLVDSLVKKEGVIVEENIRKVGEKRGLKLDFEKPNRNVQQKLLPKASISKVETTAQSGSVRSSIALPGWPSNLQSLGYMPSLQTVVPMDGIAESSKALQPPQFIPEPRPKRCATHNYIACNIRLHQQFTKTNHFWPATAGSAALCGAKPKDLNAMPPAENMIIGSTLQGSFPFVNLNPAQDKVQAVANIPVFTRKDRSSESTTLIETAQKQQLVLPQPPQPAPAGNLMHGPAFIFSLNQHQASTATMTSQAGPSKSAPSINNASLPGNGIAGLTTNSPGLPAMAAAVSFSYPNLAANETPYLTILPNNGYPFPISTPAGNQPTFRGGTPAQAFPFFNGSFYSSQMLHPSQLQQQQTQPVVQPGHQNASNSSGSSSSHKQPQSRQPRGAHASTNTFLTSAMMQSQQPPKHVQSHHSRKLDTEMSGESIPIIADTRAGHSKKSVHGPNFMVPVQPNYGLMASTTVGGSGNHGEKQQHQLSQEKNLKGGVELIPSQAFAMSFASFNGSKTASNLNFSAMTQNPPILQSFPDMTRQGYQVISAAQATQKKNHQPSEGKTAGSSINPDDGKKTTLGKSTMGNGQTLVFDNSARTLNFVSTGNWPSQSITTTTSIPMAANSSSTSHQQQLVQLQKQHILHQQLQPPIGAADSKASISNSLPLPSNGAKFPNNAPVFSQTQALGNSSPQNPQWKNSSRIPSSQAPLTSLSASNTSVHKNAFQQQGRVPQGHSQISFGSSSTSALPPQGQQISSSSQSPSSGGRTTSKNAKANSSTPGIQSQQSDNSSSGNAQKSSPVCGRNVPSILSACPSHLSELKY
ncbi:PROTEIN TIME FOR COFFEE [Salix koriyanagi]|uniref:PROTEIN TIME FOR COFFEE n=1 Tax=Salix koriyanagi TaxID=2511006 RepID=A0A9Q0QLP5_9ROSI|nr:PROTEIN TIME FOR COFFEE [Salix koriyanagi]